MGARRLAGWTAAAVLALPAAALAAPASPDPGYGSGGTAATGLSSAVAGMILDSGGRAVIAAQTGGAVTLVRRLPNGAPDFAKTALLDTQTGPVAELPGGGYAVGGSVEQPIGRTLALARFAAAETEGTVTESPEVGDEIRALAVQDDGKIVAAGRVDDGRIAVARYAPTEGSAESSFSGPLDVASFAGQPVTGEEASGVVVAPRGRIVMAGSGVVRGERRFLLVALTPTGGLDTSFGRGGVTALDVGDGIAAVNSLVRQPDGKLLVAGTTDRDGGGGGVVARFLSDGMLDTGFSTDGIARLGVPNAVVNDVAVQPDGKIVAVGSAGGDAVFARFRPGGARDPGFGTDGVVRRSFGSGLNRLTGVGVSADGGIVAGGIGSFQIVAARLVGGDSSDPALAMTAESLGTLVTFTLTATNHGADAARDVRVTVDPPGAVAATALTTAGSVCEGVTCSLGTVPAGATRRMTLLARARRPGQLSAAARIGAATFDANPRNNSAGATATARRNRVAHRDRTKPKLKVRLRARRIKQVRQRVTLALRTSERTTAVVRTKWIKVGQVRTFANTRTVKLRGKKTKLVRLRLTQAGRQHVVRKKTQRLTLAVTVRARDRAGNKRKKTLRKTLRRHAQR